MTDDEALVERMKAAAGKLGIAALGPMRAALLEGAAALEALPARDEAVRCEYCDGTGDVHSIDGEWRGRCTCEPASGGAEAELRAALKLAKDMFVANNLSLPHTFYVIDRALALPPPAESAEDGTVADDLVSRAEVLRIIRRLGDQDADLALYGAEDNARAREYGEAAATRACCAIALMPSHAPMAAREIRAEIIRLMRKEFDPKPPNYSGYSWDDNAEAVADSIIKALASPALAESAGGGAVAPAGWKLVPIVPTPAMRMAGQGWASPWPFWKAMLAASPSPDTGEGAIRAEREACAKVAEGHDCMPCSAPAAWRADVVEHYNDGQIDACRSVAAAIRARG